MTKTQAVRFEESVTFKGEESPLAALLARPIRPAQPVEKEKKKPKWHRRDLEKGVHSAGKFQEQYNPGELVMLAGRACRACGRVHPAWFYDRRG